MNGPASNPFLAGSHYSLPDSFGGVAPPVPVALAPPTSAAPAPPAPPSAALADAFNLAALPPLSALTQPPSATPTGPCGRGGAGSASLGPPPAGVFLLPGAHTPTWADAPPTLPVTAPGPGAGSEVACHWFYRTVENEQAQWQPFAMIDSVALEDAYLADPTSNRPLATDGGRYDVSIAERLKQAVYWPTEPSMPIRRCSWFYRANADGRWWPYSEAVADQLEAEYAASVREGRWNRQIELADHEHIILHSPTVMMHFPAHAGLHTNLDDWGQVQPQNPQEKPRVVHRGLDGLPDIPDGESPEVDHLMFVVHGIGSVCDMRFRSIVQVVDGFRELTSNLSERHFQAAHLTGSANRIEYLPVNWHKTLHGEDTGTDQRIRPLALKSIPKLREFVSDTLLDILFYTSPIYCQKIIDTVVSEINRMHGLFMQRNPAFQGTCSVMGHSLGSLILFDVLSHQRAGEDQTSDSPREEAPSVKPPSAADLSLEVVFDQLNIGEYTQNFTREGIDMQSLLLCTEDDLKEGGLPLGPRKKLLSYMEAQKARHDTTLTGLEAFQQSSVTSEVKYSIGPAGTGQPSVHYPRLCFQPSAFYALGSPISMFLAVRGMGTLGSNFKLPTCPRFFNIFHPYDPVAYRVESLIDPEYAKMRPLIIPHHKGRKRMHLEIKDTVTKLMTTDFRQKFVDSISATLNTMYSIATGSAGPDKTDQGLAQALEESMKQNADESERADELNPRTLESPLNSGKRIDYALQEAPLESFNEYLFALASHLVYWESEDVCLMVLKDIYDQMSVLSDEAKASAYVPYLDTSSHPPSLQQSNTPILAPPPVPMGGAMAGPPIRINPLAPLPPVSMTPQVLAPPPLTLGMHTQPPMSVPSTPQMSSTSILGPTLQMSSTSILGPTPTAAISPLGPPPMMMAPAAVQVSASPGRPSYPKPSYPVHLPPSVSPLHAHAAPSTFGMDPTAPVASDRPVAPPPMSGFYSKK
eukprot:snap_masked-scaffold240_size241964-processed-gene-1.2 protein:Tk08264 transcript:snap_masked-scaffold240_size241964-processed-gene-1.2-mRNA-1 annotation:"sec23-interacting protein"